MLTRCKNELLINIVLMKIFLSTQQSVPWISVLYMSTAALNSRSLGSEVAGKLRKRATPATCVLPHHHAVGAVLWGS